MVKVIVTTSVGVGLGDSGWVAGEVGFGVSAGPAEAVGGGLPAAVGGVVGLTVPPQPATAIWPINTTSASRDFSVISPKS
jgi:hypothetical protein